MKRKIVLYIGMDNDGTGDWACSTHKQDYDRASQCFDSRKGWDFGFCKTGVAETLGAPPCKPGKQVKVTLRVEKIEKVEARDEPD